jgi:3-oxoacyl-[acyl-carrier protein] reductase
VPQSIPPPEKQREQIDAEKINAEDIVIAAHYMLAQPRRAAVSLLRREDRITG